MEKNISYLKIVFRSWKLCMSMQNQETHLLAVVGWHKLTIDGLSVSRVDFNLLFVRLVLRRQCFSRVIALHQTLNLFENNSIDHDDANLIERLHHNRVLMIKTNRDNINLYGGTSKLTLCMVCTIFKLYQEIGVLQKWQDSGLRSGGWKHPRGLHWPVSTFWCRCQ